jgi:hypothetical protein
MPERMNRGKESDDDLGDLGRALPAIAGVLGLVFLALAALYWFTPAGSLPEFLPGFKAGSEHVHVRHALGSLVVSIILFGLAWFQSARGR